MVTPAMDVALIRWPTDSERRGQLAEAGAPRLLLLESGQGPPDPGDCLEDWVRVPASEEEVRARVDGLRARVRAHGFSQPGFHSRPELDPYGVLRFQRRWVSLPPVEARMTAALIERFRAVVSREALAQAGWPEGAPGRNALDVHVVRLRRRLDAVGLAIRTVRSRGYLLEPSQSGQLHASEA
jgi:DNA-binding response OmpR family regulator